MNQSLPNKLIYRSEIDGLRAFAVLSVVAFHAFPSWLKGGFIGVDVFFVISGFLITSHIFESLKHGSFSFTDFFGRRIRRIFPALILVMICALILGWFSLLSDELIQLSRHIASGAGFFTNFILASEVGYFDNAAETKPMLHLWSLAVEEQFYIIWPFILWFSWKRKYNLLFVTVIVALVSFFTNIYFIKYNPNETFYLPFGRFWELLSGSILAWLFIYKRDTLGELKDFIDGLIKKSLRKKYANIDGEITINVMSILGFIVLFYGFISIDKGQVFPSFLALVPVVGAILIIGGGSKAYLNRLLLMNPVAIWFGLISYPLYLWHWPILSFLQIIEGELPHENLRIFSVIMSIFIAWLTYRFIERPIRFGNKNIATTTLLTIAMVLIGAIGIYINKIGGNTPYNVAQQYIADAKGDWSYPKGLVEQFGVKSTSKAPPTVLIFGDSTVEAFSPRVVDLYRKGVSNEIAFLTTGGCAPLPDSYKDETYIEKCSRNFENLGRVLSIYPIETIILGGAYEHYYIHDKYSFYLDEEGKHSLLSSDNGKRKSIRAFVDFVDNLSQSYEVVVLSHAVFSESFSPTRIMMGNEKRRQIPLGGSINKSSFSIDTSFEIEMESWVAPLGVKYISQSEKICPDNICLPLTSEGKPKYKDSYHMRPFYAISYMDVLDDFLMKSKE